MVVSPRQSGLYTNMGKTADHRFANAGTRTSKSRRSTRISMMSPEAMILPTDSENEVFRKKMMESTKYRYPMYGLPIDELMKLTKPVDHQTLLQQGKLVKIEEGEQRDVVFLSHQWVPILGNYLVNSLAFQIVCEPKFVKYT